MSLELAKQLNLTAESPLRLHPIFEAPKLNRNLDLDLNRAKNTRPRDPLQIIKTTEAIRRLDTVRQERQVSVNQ